MSRPRPILRFSRRLSFRSGFSLLAAFAAAGLPLSTGFVRAEGEWNPDTTFPSLSPEDSIKTIEVPKGFRLECVASEPMVEEPSSFAFDGNGALYVTEWLTYMQDEHATGQLDPVSRVVKLTDTDGDGKMDKRTVFIDNTILPRAVLPLQDRVLVYFTEDQTIWSYFDDNKDGVADRREIAWQGEPDHGNIEHQQSGLLWNLDNTICTNDRRLVWSPGGKLTALPHSRGRISQWGLARDDDGRLICSWGGGANPAHSFQLPAGYPILDLKEHEEGYFRPWGICPVWDFSDGGYDVQRQAQLTHFSATCGQSVVRSPLFPQWHGNSLGCEPVGRLIRMTSYTWQDGKGTAHNAFPGSEFVRSKDAYFRPVWTDCGPDGGIYIADLYRGIIQEKEWFPTSVTPELKARYVEDYRKNKLELWVERYERVKRWGMIKVHRHGRIYRLLPEDKSALKLPRMLDEPSTELVRHLANPSGWWRDTAQMLLVSRGDQSAIPALEAMTGNPDTNARIHSLWTLRGLKALKKETVLAAFKDKEPRVRRAAVQLAESWLIQNDAETTSALTALNSDPDAQVATQAFLAWRAAARPDQFHPVPAGRPLPLVAALQQNDVEENLQQKLSPTARQGRLVYESLCISCHGPDGMGLKAADTLLAPPLAKSAWMADNGNLPVLGRILLKGLTGPIDGVTYGAGLMPPLENTHTDAQLAQVLTYAGERWHHWTRPLTAEDITRIRQQTATRTAPWTPEELNALTK